MPAATEGAAPAKAASALAKPKEPTAKSAEGSKKPAGEKKVAAPAAEKKPVPAKKAADKKPADKKPADKKPADKKPTEKKPIHSDGKPADKKMPTATKKDEEVVDEAPVAPVYVPKLPVTLAVLNTLEWASCAKVFGNLLNMTPALGAAIAQLRPFRSTQHLVDLLNQALDALPAHYIEIFLKRFRELPLIPKGQLTKEHKCCVGLDSLTEEQKSELTPLYTQYREKFGFPFVVCAREAKAGELASALKSRLHNEKAQELENGRKEAKKIARLRLLEVVVA